MNKMPSPLGLGSDYRIYLIGAPGSGKSFLAERLSHALHIAWHDLDGEDIDALPLLERITYRKALQQQKGWICEAVSQSIGRDWIQAADITIVLTTPRIVRIWRVLFRALLKTLGRQFKGQWGKETWASLRFRLGMTWRYDKTILYPFLEEIQRLGLPVVVFSDNQAAYAAVVERLTQPLD
ncbi:MAG: hypothetical protein C7B47_08340 [Sulfobacillus thermosulfidooxidans]|uniref:Adenylate kinase n=1 Tax=Sulfobacillus thermosulfidooxidans TaxID=28034 RepID=A0A2T2WYQ0_SULTH|nr:MAG: hypothetical protein C7B47_08340 [Sulfobacillus thermosulfidooxidans]